MWRSDFVSRVGMWACLLCRFFRTGDPAADTMCQHADIARQIHISSLLTVTWPQQCQKGEECLFKEHPSTLFIICHQYVIHGAVNHSLYINSHIYYVLIHPPIHPNNSPNIHPTVYPSFSSLHLSIHQLERKGNVLFNNTLNTFYLWLYGVGHMVKDHSDIERGNLLLLHRLLFPVSSKGSFICTIP